MTPQKMKKRPSSDANPGCGGGEENKLVGFGGGGDVTSPMSRDGDCAVTPDGNGNNGDVEAGMGGVVGETTRCLGNSVDFVDEGGGRKNSGGGSQGRHSVSFHIGLNAP